MKLNITLLLLFFSCINVRAQVDSAAVLTDMYQRAAKLYEADKFTDAVTLLERAETLSPTPNARILYLKIKSLNSLYQKDASYGSALEKVIPVFMSVAQAQNYPPAKIQDIAVLQQQLMASQQQARVDADRAVATEKENNQRLYEEQKKSLDADFAEANRLMKRTGVGKRLVGLLLLGVSGLEVSSMTNAEAGDFSTTKFVVALVSFSVGIVLLTSPSGRKHGKILLKQAQERQRQLEQRRLSFSPKLNFQPGSNQYGLAIRFRF